MNVIFRADASSTVGAGHIMRCLSLAYALRARGAKVDFAVNREAPDCVSQLSGSGFGYDFADKSEAVKSKWPGGCDWLVVDHYGLDETFERPLQGWAKNILVIDDLADRSHACSALLDPSPARTDDHYRRLVGAQPVLLLGPQYALLRQRFSELRESSLRRRSETAGVQRILVSFGGGDVLKPSDIALKAIEQAGFRGVVDLVVGQNKPHFQDVWGARTELEFHLSIFEQAQDMADMMAAADLSVGAAGSTAWERCALGVPTLMLTLADNQLGIAAVLDELGAAADLGTLEGATIEKLASQIDLICRNNSFRAKMSESAAHVCDGQGAQRVADFMMEKG